MSGIVIIGGGFAGAWSAAAAALVRGEADLNITLVAPNEDMVLRPRLHRMAPDWSRVPLKRFLEPVGVTHLRAEVTEIDTDARRITANDQALSYDRLVLAAGSRLARPAIPGSDLLYDIDTAEGAARLAARLNRTDGARAVVVGSGFTGIEIATELAERGTVVMVERADTVAPDLGPGPRPQIEAALAALGIEVRLGTTVTAVDETGAHLIDGTRLAADVVVWTGGMRASLLTAQVPGERDRLGRLLVDRRLRVDGEVFAAGDVAAAHADADHHVLQSCQFATPMGKAAGHNAAADLLGVPLVDFDPDPYVTCLDLGSAGALYTTGWDRQVQLDGAQAKQVKDTILDVIHPPLDDAEEILQQAGRQSNGVSG